MTLPDVNHLAVVAAAVSSFVLGGLWYSPALFGRTWQREAQAPDKQGHPAIVFGLSFVLALFAAWVFAIFLGPNPPLQKGLISGVCVGFFWVMTSFGINYAFAQRSFKLWLIDGGYHTAQFALYGLILGLWH